MQKRKIVVIGGGTGSYSVLRGLKKFSDQVSLTAIVTMSDSGGSTGRLRDEFGYLPVGDLRMALTALASEDDEHELLLRDLFAYRFAKGEGLAGHNFGNLLLVALSDLLDSPTEAIDAASKVLKIDGRVLPVTNTSTHLLATYEDGTTLRGEHLIDEPRRGVNMRITNLSVEPTVQVSPQAKQAILEADTIILGPGDVYTSVLANCVVPGVKEALQQTNARIVYVCNLMTKSGQTDGFTTVKHFTEISRYIEKEPDVMLYNTTALPEDLLERYASEDEYPVKIETLDDQRFIGLDLLATGVVETVRGDTLRRSFLRHDAEKLARAIMSL